MAVMPMGDRILVKPHEAEDKVKSGIYIPDTAKEKPQKATVVEVGPGRTTDEGKVIACTVAKGDTILYGKYSGTEITVDDVEYLIMRETDVLAILK